MDVFAAYVAYTDHEIGRVIQAIEDMGKLDNTLIIYINGDNGTSAEGTLLGTPNEVAMFNGVDVPVEVQLEKFYDVWGSDQTYNHMAVPWAWAFDTPFSWTKQIASHLGGVRQGMAISWPKVIKDKGGIRNQFHHVIDIVPTILEATGIRAPEVVDGIEQSPIEGVSMAYTFDKKNADAPSTHKTQYFEMMGDRAHLPRRLARQHQGDACALGACRRRWTNPCRTTRGSSTTSPRTGPSRGRRGEAPGEAQGAAEPVLEGGGEVPGAAARRDAWRRDSSHRGRASPRAATCSPGHTRSPARRNGDAPSVLNASYTFKAEIEVPKGGGEGMLITQGGRFGGYGFYLLKGKPVFLWNLVDLKRIRWEGAEALSPGKHVLEFDFTLRRPRHGHAAFGSISGIGQAAPAC